MPGGLVACEDRKRETPVFTVRAPPGDGDTEMGDRWGPGYKETDKGTRTYGCEQGCGGGRARSGFPVEGAQSKQLRIREQARGRRVLWPVKRFAPRVVRPVAPAGTRVLLSLIHTSPAGAWLQEESLSPQGVTQFPPRRALCRVLSCCNLRSPQRPVHQGPGGWAVCQASWPMSSGSGIPARQPTARSWPPGVFISIAAA